MPNQIVSKNAVIPCAPMNEHRFLLSWRVRKIGGVGLWLASAKNEVCLHSELLASLYGCGRMSPVLSDC
jgi:hypothetical protein